MASDLIVTTSRNGAAQFHAEAEHWARALGTVAVSRVGSIADTCDRAGVKGALIVGANGPRYLEPAIGLEYFFHPSMARARIKNIRTGHPDPMITAMDLGPGDTVLDCTVGRASDALVAAFITGENGRVVGIEKSPIIAQLTIHGAANYVDTSPRITNLLRRLEIHEADYNEFLPICASNSFGVVYFDPVFHEPVLASKAMKPLRAIADKSTVTPRAFAEALRVARRRVVIKQAVGTPLWDQLGITEVRANSTQRIEYGYAMVNDD